MEAPLNIFSCFRALKINIIVLWVMTSCNVVGREYITGLVGKSERKGPVGEPRRRGEACLMKPGDNFTFLPC
jgi:hypothetical protein